MGIRTVLGTGAGVLRSRGLSDFVAGCSLRRRTALDRDAALRKLDEPGVPLRRTTLLGYGLLTLVPEGDIFGCKGSSSMLTDDARACTGGRGIGSGVVRAVVVGDC